MTKRTEMAKPTILMFRPFQKIKAFLSIENAFREALVWQSGADILTVFCGRVLDKNCVVFDSRPSQQLSRWDRTKLCRDCVAQSERTSKPEDQEISLETFLDSAAETWARKIRKGAEKEGNFGVVIDGLPIGRWTTYDSLLKFKQTKLETKEIRRHYFSNLESCLRAYAVAVRISEKWEVAGVAVNHFQYAINRAFAAPFGAKEIPIYDYYQASTHVSFGVGFRVNLVEKLRKSPYLIEDLRYREGINRPIQESESELVGKWVLSKVRASSPGAYSKPRSEFNSGEIRKILGLSETKKTAVYLVSSPDEMVALSEALLRPEGFLPYSDTDQEDTLGVVFRVAEQAPGWQFVVRMHPRLGGENRNESESDKLQALNSALQSRPKNVAVSWPADSVGMWDLAMVADVVLNRGSTAGLEFLLAGIPVVTFGGDYHEAYPSYLNSCASTLEPHDVVDALERAQAGGWSSETIVRSMRWLATWLYRTVLFPSKVLDDYDAHPQPSADDESKPPAGNQVPGSSSDSFYLHPTRVLDRWANLNATGYSPSYESLFVDTYLADLWDALAPWSGSEGSLKLLNSGFRKSTPP